MRWSPDRSRLAVAEDDVKVAVVKVKEGQVEVRWGQKDTLTM